jgi:hypothetical protein
MIFSLTTEKLRPLEKTVGFAKSIIMLTSLCQLLLAGVTFSKKSVLSGRCSPFAEKPVYPYTITTIQVAQINVQVLLIFIHLCSYNVHNWQPHIKSKEADIYLAVFK